MRTLILAISTSASYDTKNCSMFLYILELFSVFARLRIFSDYSAQYITSLKNMWRTWDWNILSKYLRRSFEKLELLLGFAVILTEEYLHGFFIFIWYSSSQIWRIVGSNYLPDKFEQKLYIIFVWMLKLCTFLYLLWVD